MRALWIGCLAACGAGSQAAGYDNASWTDHMQAAAQHDARAVEHEREARIAAADSGPASYSCGDVVLNDQLTTGGQRITSWQPCWDLDEKSAQHQPALADRERPAARHDR